MKHVFCTSWKAGCAHCWLTNCCTVLQPSQRKPAGEGGAGAVATSGAAEKGGLPDNDLADENSRMQRSTSGSRSANAGKGTNPRFQ